MASTCGSCTGARDVAAACGACQTANTCPSCNACQSGNSATCAEYNTCLRCTACNTRCNACQSICETNQVFTGACGNAMPGDHWTNVQDNNPIIQDFPQGKFYWAWEWLRSAINYGQKTHSPGASNTPTPYPFLQAADWNQLDGVMNSIKSGSTVIGQVTGGPAGTKITGNLVRTAGSRLAAVRLNKIACHYQNTVWDSCGPTSSECCQTCMAGCMVCNNNTPQICTHYGCQSCNSCYNCNSCQGCNSCQQCVSCQGACNTCNNCNSEQTG